MNHELLMDNPASAMNHIEKRVAHYTTKARGIRTPGAPPAMDRAFRHLKVPSVRFDVRGSTAGKASRDGQSVRFNMDIAMANWERFDQTIAHEVAHSVVAQVWGWASGRGSIKPHGKEWQYVMRCLGFEPERCHSMEVPQRARTVRYHAIRCGCPGGGQVSTVRANRMLKGTRYRCGQCNQVVELV